MKFGIYEILTLLGSLGVFLFGMKMMSEALQVIAGDKMRKILSAMTSNRFLGVLTGFLVTSVIQSSSATTVMIVSFVNAGLMSLVESVGVIMGANIGTTITAWLISILGFKISMSAISLPLIAIGFPLMFSKNHKTKGHGEFLIGFALLFIGLAYLKDSVPDVKSNPEILEFLASYTTMGYGSVFLFLLIGTILTIVVQSSSASMALTLVMCYEGWIPFELAAAMVLGENIGTTITANLAAFVANTTAKRAALAHLLFNIFGVVWMLTLFYPFINLVNYIVISAGESSPFVEPTAIPIALSVFHTVFNITNTFIMIWFVATIVKVVTKILPVNEEEESEVFKLKHISTRLLSTSDLSILPAKNEIIDFSKHLLKMFGSVRKAMITTNIAQFEKHLIKIKKYEDICDSYEKEIADYLTQLTEAELSHTSSKYVRLMFKLIDDLETIGDQCYSISMTIAQAKLKQKKFNKHIEPSLNELFELIQEAFMVMEKNLLKEFKDVSMTEVNQIEIKIKKLRNKIKEDHIENISKRRYKYQEGIAYNDLIAKGQSLVDHAKHVSEVLDELKNGDD